MLRTIFMWIESSSMDYEFSVVVNMAEIYMEKVNDLLDPTKMDLDVREDKVRGPYIKNISDHWCLNEQDVLDLVLRGTNNRQVGSTNMNDKSSRSHVVFTLSLRMNNRKEGIIKTSKLHLVDLAGSESLKKTGAVGQSMKEGNSINQSLSILSRVIFALTDEKVHHIPYRESKLTRLLMDSLGGNSKTAIIVNVSPSALNDLESLRALRYGSRTQKITNSVKVNQELSYYVMQSHLEKAKERISELSKYNILYMLTRVCIVQSPS